MFSTYFATYKYVIIGIIIAAIIAGLFYLRHSIIVTERNRVNKEWQAKEATLQIEQQNRLFLINKEIANKQLQLEVAQKKIIEKSKETENAKKAYKDLLSKYANGSLRLRVPAAPKGSAAEQVGNTSAARGSEHNSCELLPELSSEILRFAREYSDNLQKLNTIRELYNEIRKANNG